MTTTLTDVELAERHKYRLPDGTVAINVTAVSGCLDLGKSDRMAGAAAKLAKQGLDYRAEWRAKADTGTRVHAVCEQWLRGEDAEVQDGDQGYVDALEKFWTEHEPVLVECEAVALSHHGYGGRFDVVADLNDGRRLLIDLKGLATWTPIPTPTGWTTMGALNVGDQVFGADGHPCTVTAKSRVHSQPCFRVVFDDGSDIICDADHRWPVTHMGTGMSSVLTTTQLVSDLQMRLARGSQRRQAVLNAAPLTLPDAELPLDPYLLGTWLGDGTRRRSQLTLSVQKQPIRSAWEAAGYRVTSNGGRTGWDLYIAGGLRQTQRQLGLDLGDKFVPPIYLRGSARQRLALLQGLMDTDGTWNVKRSQAVFTSTTKQLQEDVYELVVSLGWRASTHSYEATGFGVTTTAHTVSFTPFGALPFRLVDHKRDQASLRLTGTAHSRRRMVRHVIAVPTVPTQCIEVDSPTHTYLCGRQMVPTHNTGKQYPVEHTLQLSAYRFADGIAEYDDAGMLRLLRPVPVVDACACLYVRSDGTYSLVEYPSDDAAFAKFLALLDAVRWAKSDDMKALEKRAREAA